MLRIALPVSLVLSIAFAPLCALAENKFSLKSVSVELPDADRMFDGPGSDVANNNCLACHSADMVLNQPALPRAQWHAEVEKMLVNYKAPVDPKDVGPIVDYLFSIRGAR